MGKKDTLKNVAATIGGILLTTGVYFLYKKLNKKVVANKSKFKEQLSEILVTNPKKIIPNPNTGNSNKKKLTSGIQLLLVGLLGFAIGVFLVIFIFEIYKIK